MDSDEARERRHIELLQEASREAVNHFALAQGVDRRVELNVNLHRIMDKYINEAVTEAIQAGATDRWLHSSVIPQAIHEANEAIDRVKDYIKERR